MLTLKRWALMRNTLPQLSRARAQKSRNSNRSKVVNKLLILNIIFFVDGGQHSHDHIDPANRRSLRRWGELGNNHTLGRDVLQPPGPLEKEVMVFVGIGVEI